MPRRASVRLGPEWEPYAEAAKRGTIQFIPVTTEPLPTEKRTPSGRRGPTRTVDPARPFAAWATRVEGGAKRPRCPVCLRPMRRGDLLACGTKCLGELEKAAQTVLRVLANPRAPVEVPSPLWSTLHQRSKMREE